MYAVVRALEIISEATRRLPDELKRRHPNIDWAAVAAAGNGNRLKALAGEMSGRHSIRVNDQYRVTFRWENGHAFEVAVEDDH